MGDPEGHIPQVYGYVREFRPGRHTRVRHAPTPETQQETVQRAAEALGLGRPAIYQDAPSLDEGLWDDAANRGPFADRPAGGELSRRLRPGDTLIAAQADLLCRSLAELCGLFDRCERLGVRLVLCDFPTITGLAGPGGEELLRLVVTFGRAKRRARATETHEALGIRRHANRAVSAYPGYGFMWKREWDRKEMRYVKVKVPCPDERRVMGLILDWHIRGHDWCAITEHLAATGEINKDGRPWVRSRVIRACNAEVVLRAAEAAGAAEPAQAAQ
jgi:hypothetical protein